MAFLYGWTFVWLLVLGFSVVWGLGFQLLVDNPWKSNFFAIALIELPLMFVTVGFGYITAVNQKRDYAIIALFISYLTIYSYIWIGLVRSRSTR